MTREETVEILLEARSGLFMWNMGVKRLDRVLSDLGVDVSALPQHPDYSKIDYNVQGQNTNAQAV